MSTTPASSFKPLTRAEISYLVAHDFPDGSVVNLGIGMLRKFLTICLKIAKFCCTVKTEFWGWAVQRLEMRSTSI